MNIANPYITGPNAVEDRNHRLRRWASVASILIACILIAAKSAAYVMTGSVSVMTSLLDSIFDAFTSGVTMFSVMHAATPADQEHRYGHGKIEALAALAQGVFILASAVYLLYQSGERFLHPQPVKDAGIGMIVMGLSIVLTAVLIAIQYHVIKRAGSIAISADYLERKGDLMVNASVLAALVLGSFFSWPYFDPLFACGIALMLFYGAWKISRDSYAILMDQELPDEERAKIEAVVKAHPKARDMHDLRTRNSGQRIFIEFHLEIDGNMSLRKAHDITEELEALLYKEFPNADVLIHQEPAGLDDHRIDDQIKG
jgi:ferrous-iron efflux pump FieF